MGPEEADLDRLQHSGDQQRQVTAQMPSQTVAQLAAQVKKHERTIQEQQTQLSRQSATIDKLTRQLEGTKQAAGEAERKMAAQYEVRA